MFHLHYHLDGVLIIISTANPNYQHLNSLKK